MDPSSAANGLPLTGAELIAAGTVETFVRQCLELYRSDWYLLSLRRLLCLETLVLSAGLPSLRSRAASAMTPAAERSRADQEDLAAIFRIEAQLEPELAKMLDTPKWRLIHHSKGSPLDVRTFLHVENDGAGRAAIKVSGVLPHALSTCCAPLLQADLFSKWVPGISRSAELHAPSSFRKLLYLRAISIPMLPFISTRDAVCEGYGDVYSPNSVAVYLRSLEEPAEMAPMQGLVDSHSPPHSTVRFELNGGFIFEVLGDKSTRVEASLKFDIRMKVVPPALIDWLMKHVAAQFVPLLAKQVSKFEQGGKLCHLMTQGRDAAIYKEMNRRLEMLVG